MIYQDKAPQHRVSRSREYLMCAPAHFAVEYVLNPWMDPTTPVDAELAVKEWERLRETLVGLGHTVHVLPAEDGLPDQVYAANGAFSVEGVVYGARFRYPQRAAEAALHAAWYAERGPAEWRLSPAREVNEGEGDFAFLPGVSGGLVLAGFGFRTEIAAHAEAQEVLGHPVISLRLVDPRFYHLDTALGVLDDRHIAYFPGAFSPGAQRVLRRLFPDAVLADESEALAFGLNLVSDGRHVVLNSEATGLASKLARAGYEPVPVEFSELKKGGGSVKCCVAELRPA